MFNKVAGGVGACVARYALPASGKNEKEGFRNELKTNNTPFAFEQEVRKWLPGVSYDADDFASSIAL